jgi:phospholipid/cholesterol/gamma-HCH transport system substrate-binding protein
MDQLKSNSGEHGGAQRPPPVLPNRSFSLEFFVGLFTMAGVAACGYLAIGLGDFRFSNADKYMIYAEFDNISGLKSGASVEIAGVPIGEVSAIELKDPMARVALRINRGTQLRDDDIASIRTKGIIGDRYVKISRGGSTQYIPEDGTLTETESVVDIEDVIGKIVHSLSSKDDSETKEEK